MTRYIRPADRVRLLTMVAEALEVESPVIGADDWHGAGHSLRWGSTFVELLSDGRWFAYSKGSSGHGVTAQRRGWLDATVHDIVAVVEVTP